MIALLMALAFAGELPAPPAVAWSAPEACRAVYGVDPGDELPKLPDQEGCSYVIVPADIHADLLKWQIHAEEVRALYAIETLELEVAMREGFAWRDSRIVELEKPPAFMQRASTQRAVGFIEATGAIVLGIVVVNHATDF